MEPPDASPPEAAAPPPADRPAIRFFVPTPAGPVWLSGLLARPGAPMSSVVETGEYVPQAISERYDHFASAEGPVGALGPVVNTLLIIDRPIDHGRSWELAVLLMHAHRAGRLPAPDGNDDRPLLIWASGFLSFDPALPLAAQRLAGEPLHLAEKIEASRALLLAEARAGCRIVALMPDSDEGQAAATSLRTLLNGRAATVRPCATIGAAFTAITGAAVETIAPEAAGETQTPGPDPQPGTTGAGLPVPAPAGPPLVPEETPGPRIRSRWRRRAVGAVAILTGLGGAVAVSAVAAWLLVPTAILPDTAPPVAPGIATAGTPPSPAPELPAPPPAAPEPPPAQPAAATPPKPAPVVPPAVEVVGLYGPPGVSCGTFLFSGGTAGRRAAGVPSADGTEIALSGAGLCAVEIRPLDGAGLVLEPPADTRFVVAPAHGSGWTRLVRRGSGTEPAILAVRAGTAEKPARVAIRITPDGAGTR